MSKRQIIPRNSYIKVKSALVKHDHQLIQQHTHNTEPYQWKVNAEHLHPRYEGDKAGLGDAVDLLAVDLGEVVHLRRG